MVKSETVVFLQQCVVVKRLYMRNPLKIIKYNVRMQCMCEGGVSRECKYHSSTSIYTISKMASQYKLGTLLPKFLLFRHLNYRSERSHMG